MDDRAPDRDNGCAGGGVAALVAHRRVAPGGNAHLERAELSGLSQPGDHHHVTAGREIRFRCGSRRQRRRNCSLTKRTSKTCGPDHPSDRARGSRPEPSHLPDRNHRPGGRHPRPGDQRRLPAGAGCLGRGGRTLMPPTAAAEEPCSQRRRGSCRWRGPMGLTWMLNRPGKTHCKTSETYQRFQNRSKASDWY